MLKYRIEDDNEFEIVNIIIEIWKTYHKSLM